MRLGRRLLGSGHRQLVGRVTNLSRRLTRNHRTNRLHGLNSAGGLGGTAAGGAQNGAAGTDGYASLTVCAAAKASAVAGRN